MPATPWSCANWLDAGSKAVTRRAFLFDRVLPEDAGILGPVVGLLGGGLVVELPKAGHRGHHARIEALGENVADGVLKKRIGVGLGMRGGDALQVGGALGRRGLGDLGLGLCGVAGGIVRGFADRGACGGWAGHGRRLVKLGRWRGDRRRGLFLALLRFFLHHRLAINGDAHGFLPGRDVDAFEGLSGILVGQGAEEMQAVPLAFELDLVREDAHFVDANAREGVRPLRGVADERALLVEFERVVEVAAAEKEILADEEPAKLILADGRGCGGAWRSGCGGRLAMRRRRRGRCRRRGGRCGRGLAGSGGRGLLGLQRERGRRGHKRRCAQEKPCGGWESAEAKDAELRYRRSPRRATRASHAQIHGRTYARHFSRNAGAAGGKTAWEFETLAQVLPFQRLRRKRIRRKSPRMRRASRRVRARRRSSRSRSWRLAFCMAAGE